MIFDVIIVGCGINGILALEHFRKKGLNVLLVDENNHPLSFIENYMVDDLTFISSGDKLRLPQSEIKVSFLKTYFKEKLIEFSDSLVLNKRIDTVEKREDLIFVSSKDTEYLCKNLIISTGRGLPKKVENFKNAYRGIKHFNSKNILLLGSGDSSVDFIFHNYKNNKIYWVNKHLNPLEKIHKTIRDRYQKIDKTNIEILNFSDIMDLKDGSIKYKDTIINYDVCVCLIGFEMDNSFFKKNNIAMTSVGGMMFVKTDYNYETNIKNVFAIGEIVVSPIDDSHRSYIEHSHTILQRIETKIL